MASQHDASSSPLQPELYDQVFAPVEAEMLAWLDLPPGARILDAGCGPGVMAARFTAVVGPSGQGDALDQNPQALERAREYLAGSPHAERVQLHQGDLLRLPFDDESFDPAWTSFVLHHIPDPVAAARELRRVVRPGGRVVVRETGVPLRMLPFDLGIGEPDLQDRLRVAHNRWFNTIRYAEPVDAPYPFGWSQVLRDAGCQGVTVRTFWLELLPSFTAVQEQFLLDSVQRHLDKPELRALLDPADVETVTQLTDPASPYYLLARLDLHVLAGLSLYVGTVG
ncbi:class I SAM-dependent methyltransferase [Chloroflexus sp.]|uniref:class I SAM-dependent methyltransferase n=1 Tax=Chloroflexus sp. TaxID=1904827 RepID=UPI00404A7F63